MSPGAEPVEVLAVQMGDVVERVVEVEGVAALTPADAGDVVRARQAEREWEDVRRNLSLAIRLRSEGQVAGSIDGQERLNVRHGGQTVPMEFTLYVVPQQAV